MITYILGTINFPETINEMYIGKENSAPRFKHTFSGECYIEIRDDEGSSIPHIHITSKPNDYVDSKGRKRTFKCCVQLFKNEFFTHGSKMDELHPKDWKVLDDWMRKPVSKDSPLSNWERAREIWFNKFDHDYLKNNEPLDTEHQPDYTTILPYKKK